MFLFKEKDFELLKHLEEYSMSVLVLSICCLESLWATHHTAVCELYHMFAHTPNANHINQHTLCGISVFQGRLFLPHTVLCSKKPILKL